VTALLAGVASKARRGLPLLYRDGLEKQIAGVRELLTPVASGAKGVQVKAYEAQLDAVACAWVAICYLEGRAIAYGDANSAI
jgi:hypothetical protein